MVMTTVIQGSGNTLEVGISTGLNLTNNSLVLGNSLTFTDVGYLFADVQFSGSFSSGAPTTSTGMSVWLLREIGGFFEDGASGITPARNPDFTVPLRAVTTGQLIERQTLLPPGPCKTLVKNDGTGQTIDAGWYIKYRPFTFKQG